MNPFKAALVSEFYRLTADIDRLQCHIVFHPHDHNARDQVRALKRAVAPLWARVLAA